MSSPQERLRRCTDRLAELAWRVRRLFDGAAMPLVVRAERDDGHGTVEIVYLPAGVEPERNPEALAVHFLQSTFFSPTEAVAVLAMAERPLLYTPATKRIAQLTGESESKAGSILANLKDRGILRSGRDGYEVTDPAFAELARAQQDRSKTAAN